MVFRDGVYGEISRQNPWWHKGIDIDEDYRKWMESRVRWIPRGIYDVSLEPFSLNIIFGPRQVGKSTLIKLMIKMLLDKGVDPYAIFYFRCDKLGSYKELSRVLEAYLKLRKRMNIAHSYIFIDEATYPREWFRSIKYLIDVGEFRNDVLVVSGSLSMYVKKEVETFPGRRGHGKNFVMYPLSFRDFIRIIDEKLYKKLPTVKDLDLESIIDASWRSLGFLDRLNELFELYLVSGGMPPAVKSLISKGEVSSEAIDTFISWFLYDIEKLRLDVETMKKVLTAIIEKKASPVSWLSIAKDYSIGSHVVARKYALILQNLFIAKILYFIDPNKGVTNYAKNKKIHLIDPFFYHATAALCLLPKINDPSQLVEATVAGHLGRLYPIYYWRNSHEIDVIAKREDELVGFEVTIGRATKKRVGRIGRIRKTLVLSLDEYNENPLTIPISTFLASLEIPQLVKVRSFITTY